MRAISPFSLEAGTSILGSLARTPFRIRVVMSAMGSVMFIGNYLLGLPARLDDARDVARERQLAEADAAHLELPQVRPGAAAGAAAVVLAHPELRLALGLGDQRQLGHYPSLLLVPERHPEVREKELGLLVRPGRGHEGDVHAPELVDLRVVDFREEDLVLEAQGVVPPAVEGARRHPAKVAHPREGHVEEPVAELVHAVPPQGHGGGDGHPLAEAEGRDGLPGTAHGRPLPGDLAETLHGRVEELDVLGGLPDPHVDDHFPQTGHRHDVRVAPLLHQAGDDLLHVVFLDPCAHDRAHLSRTSPLRRPTRTLRPSARVLAPIRVRLSSSEETIITFETWMGASRSAIPPLMFRCGFGRVWRLMKPTPWTMTRPFSRRTCRMRPRLPVSLPAMTSSRSFFLSRIFIDPPPYRSSSPPPVLPHVGGREG